MSSGSVTLGGNMSVALGPLGRNGEALGSLNMSGKVAAMFVFSFSLHRSPYTTPHYRYSYSRSRGLFGGVSIEGSVIVERQDANTAAYNADISAKRLLSGEIKPPEWAAGLIRTLDTCTGMPSGQPWKGDRDGGAKSPYLFGSVESPRNEKPSMFSGSQARKNPKQRGSNSSSTFPPTSWGSPKDKGSYFDDLLEEPSSSSRVSRSNTSATANFETQFESDFVPEQTYPRSTHKPSNSRFNRDSPSSNQARSSTVSSYSDRRSNPFSSSETDQEFFQTQESRPFIAPKPELAKPLLPHEGVARGIALFNFRAVQVRVMSHCTLVMTFTLRTDFCVRGRLGISLFRKAM
jgi:SH3 domain-containing YSC84-like protein 1